MSLRFAALRPTAVWSCSVSPSTQPLSLVPRRGTRERTGLLSAAPAALVFRQWKNLRGYRLHFRESWICTL